MKLHHGLICFFLLSLWDKNSGFISAALFYYTVTQGEEVEMKCPSSSAFNRKFFCKGSCRGKDILIDTTAANDQNGRFSIEWKQTEFSQGDVYVTMSELTKSDSGLYRCGVGSSLSSAKYEDIEIIVVDALLIKDGAETLTLYPKTTGNITVACGFYLSTVTLTNAFLCGASCWTLPVTHIDNTYYRGRFILRYVQLTNGADVYVTISQLKESDSGWYTCGFLRRGMSNLERSFQVNVTDETSTSVPSFTTPSKGSPPPETTQHSVTTNTTGLPLYVGVTLAALLVLLSLALLIFCRRKSSKPKEPPEENEYASIPEAKYTEPGGIEMKSENIPGPPSPSAAEDDSSKVTYSELEFSNRTVRSPNSAPSGHADTVIYSTPR